VTKEQRDVIRALFGHYGWALEELNGEIILKTILLKITIKIQVMQQKEREITTQFQGVLMMTFRVEQ
jgi:replication initiation and membrane attachment protein DnaB